MNQFGAFEERCGYYIRFQTIPISLLMFASAWFDAADRLNRCERVNIAHFKWRVNERAHTHTQIEIWKCGQSITMPAIHLFSSPSLKYMQFIQNFMKSSFESGNRVSSNKTLNCLDFQKDTAMIHNFFSLYPLFCQCSSPGIIRNSFVWLILFFLPILNMELASIINFDLSCKVKKNTDEMRAREREREICGRNQ